MAQGTGTDFGLSGANQIAIALRCIAAGGGRAEMSDLYAAVEAEMHGNTLSEQGRASLRFFVNKVAVERGLIEPHDPADPGWRLTDRGRELLQTDLAEGAFEVGDSWAPIVRELLAVLADPRFDEQERDYKLAVAERLRQAISSAAASESDWPNQTRDALGPPNNLTNWRVNGQFLTWATEESTRHLAREAVANFADTSVSPQSRFERFAETVTTANMTPGAILSLGSLLNFAVEPLHLPLMRSMTLASFREAVGAPRVTGLPVTEQYQEHLQLFQEVDRRIREAGGHARDMLDVQGAVHVVATQLVARAGEQRAQAGPRDVALLSNRDEISAAEARFAERFNDGAVPIEGVSLGFRGGSAAGQTLSWHPGLSLWGAVEPPSEQRDGHFWNPFGVDDPTQGGAIAITCEINPARDRVDSRVGGAFAVDNETEHLLLLHRGRIGGGRSGISQELFWNITELPPVLTPDGQRFVLVADLDGPDVPEQVARFVKEVERIKAGPTQVPGGGPSPGTLTVTGRYAALADWLRDQSTSEVTTSFAFIESLVGDLPPYARKYPVFWRGGAVTDPTHTQKAAWESAGFTVTACDIPAESVTFTRLAAMGGSAPSAHAPRYWWVNQGITYDRELAGGYVWAPVRSRNGTELAHHRAVSELEVGDVILHYQRGVRAVSYVAAPPEFAPKPEELTEDDWEVEGRLASVEYMVLDEVVPLDRIPEAWRIEEGGPFNSSGGVNQGYLYPVSPEFVRRLAGLVPAVGDVLGVEAPVTSTTELEEVVTDLDEIARAVRSEGLRIDDRTLRRFHLALQARGFVILSGISGTGKTWLAEAYARAVRGELLLAPVAPNWNTNEDLLGYLNPLDGTYYDTHFSRFVRAAASEWRAAAAEQRPARPFFLILDEMNLARIEYYFAQFLSALEVRARAGVGTLHLGYDEVELGGNLKVIGTVNIDETTHGFADKVYDRAQLIELVAPRDALAAHMGNVPHARDLLAAWDALHEVAPFAFRVVDEIDGYVQACAALDVPWTDALDEQLLQKVLPKVRGVDPAAGQALEAFLTVVTPARYPLSHAKASEMVMRFHLHGSVSYFG